MVRQGGSALSFPTSHCLHFLNGPSIHRRVNTGEYRGSEHLIYGESGGGAGFSPRRTSVRLPQVSHRSRESGLKPNAAWFSRTWDSAFVVGRTSWGGALWATGRPRPAARSKNQVL